MNVVKCTNGHHFDADTYDTCPICGEDIAIESGEKESKPENKQTIKSFFGKKNKVSNVEVKKVTDGGSGTWGIYGKKKKVIEDEDLNQSKETDDNYLKEEKKTFEYEQPIVEKAKEQKQSYENEKSKELIEKEQDHDKTGDKKVESLKEAINNISSNSQGKTVGYFNSGNRSADAEPVVGWLVCLKGKHFGESFNISSGRNSIGRNDTCKIVLFKDNSVSREKHAWLTYEPKKREFYIQPGESSGLSYLNGDTVMDAKKINANDILEFGDGQYLFVPLCGEDFTWETYISKE